MRKDITGFRSGRLVAIEPVEDYITPRGKRRAKWLCQCDCGNQVAVEITNFLRGNSKSCGCLNDELRRERSVVHGGRYDPLYRIWTDMKTRCLNKNCPDYKNYGGRGVTICDEWVNSYDCFRGWALKNGYREIEDSYNCSIDRIDVNGNYTPENCRFATAKQQANNRRNTLFVTAFGERHSLSEWADITGIKYHTLFARIGRLHWEPERALSTF